MREAMAGARLGKEAAVFVASGTMGNLVSVVAHTQAGQEVVLDLDSHIYNYEVAGGTIVGNVQMRPVKTERGFLTPEQVQDSIRPSNIHIPQTGLVCLENTHNRHGGTCITPEEISAVAAVAHAAGVPVHVDGARLFNAAVALKRAPRDFVRGGMRQAGIVAAAGVMALERMVDRLAEDHTHARALAEGLATLPGISVDLASVQTNIVILRVNKGDRAQSVKAAEALVAGCAARKVKIHAMGPAAIRCVTHKDIDADDIHRALDAFRELTARSQSKN